MKIRFHVTGTSTLYGIYYSKYIYSTRARCLYSGNHQQNTVFNKFSDWSNEWFDNVQFKSPVFVTSARNIKVLSTPDEFYKELLKRSGRAKERITLASLYLGNGSLEEKLVDEIYEAAVTLKKPPKINILLEGTRGSRGEKNSRTLLLPLLRDFEKTTNIALFHTPNLRGVLKAIVPERFNETINVAHLKVYLFDNTLILTGANLSNDYFTNRQDRYIIFENCKELCDYFEDLVKTISKFCFQLQPDDSLLLHHSFPHHPYEGPKKQFNEEAGKLLQDFMDKYSHLHKSKNILELLESESENITHSKLLDIDINENNTYNDSHYANEDLHTDFLEFEEEFEEENESNTEKPRNDTLIFPLLQMRTMGINQDELVTKNIFSTAPKNTNITLATAYFNLTDDYWDAILKSDPHVDIIMAHPKAMGFYKAPGMAGGIPNAYSMIIKRRYSDLLRLNETERIDFSEFHREGWSFHGKGLWAYLDEDNTVEKLKSNTHLGPMFTLIGSPNFGKRSVHRDMEAQVGIVTINENLKHQLIKERDNMKKDTAPVKLETFKEKDREVYWWVYLIGTYMDELF